MNKNPFINKTNFITFPLSHSVKAKTALVHNWNAISEASLSSSLIYINQQLSWETNIDNICNEVMKKTAL